MNIINVGYHFKHSENFYVKRPLGTEYLLLIVKTDAYFIFDDKKNIILPNSVVVFKKGSSQFYGAVSKEFINDWIHFSIDEKEEKEFERLGIPFDTLFSVNNVSVLSEFVKDIFCEKYSQNLYKEESMELYFNLLLKKLSEKIKSEIHETKNPHFDELYKLRNKIQLNPQYNWNMEEICKMMNLSCSYIQHLYKSFFGVSVMTDVLYGRMEYAKYLLSSTDFTIYSISDMCGYANDVNFMRMFKKVTGVTPSEYRDDFQISQKELENFRQSQW